MKNRVLDDKGNFVSLKSAPTYDNPLEKEVKVLLEDNKIIRGILKSKNEELKICKKELAICEGKYAQLTKECKEKKTTWRKSKKQK